MHLEKIKEIVIEKLNLSPDVELTEDTSLRNDLNADSVDAVEIIIAIEDEYGIEVSEDVANTVDTLGQLETYLQGVIDE